MKDYLSLSCSPTSEQCAQVGQEDYYIQGPKECRVWKEQLIRRFGPLPKGLELRVVSCPHDFGTYHEVHAIFDMYDEELENIAVDMDNNLPKYWDDEAKVQLGID